jgi:hypothetical protein
MINPHPFTNHFTYSFRPVLLLKHFFSENHIRWRPLICTITRLLVVVMVWDGRREIGGAGSAFS